ncbi:ribosomal RNA small subunit methyltransferase A [Candidatus Bipolaricaulota bacterium]|nr:ribosomal RNA small subunit methyltransferase A [Candidatus Bipolaricaulota bacterium]
MPALLAVEKLTSPTVIRRILAEHGLEPRKALGQHFLADANILAKIVEAIAPAPKEVAVEVGSGLGTLTVALAPFVEKLWAVEVDPRLLPILRAHTEAFPNVHVLSGDFLDLELRSLGKELLVVGNLPYGITSEIFLKLIRERESVARAVFMVQWEVGEKLIAPPGPKANRLGVHVRTYFEVELLRKIPKTAFFPHPEVDGALIRLKKLPTPRVSLPEELWEKTLALVFSHRRKTLRRVLASSLSPAQADALLAELGLDPRVRGEALNFSDLERLGWALYRLGLLGQSR